MLKSREIQIAQSKRREKMANIQKADEINDDGRTELRSLTDAYEGAEVELRAALLVEGAERDKIKEPDKAETDFGRECRSLDLTAVIAAQTEGKAMSGREAEVSAELENRHGQGQKGLRFPWEALEERADAPTDASAGTSQELANRPVMNALERLFETSAAGRFGVNVMQVSGGSDLSRDYRGNGAFMGGRGVRGRCCGADHHKQKPIHPHRNGPLPSDPSGHSPELGSATDPAARSGRGVA